MNDYRQHMVHTLRQAGYFSVLTGIQHVASKPEIIGYDQILPAPLDKQGSNPHTSAIEFLRSRPPQPFFLDVGFGETHRVADHFHPQPPGESKTDPRFVNVPAPLPDTAETRRDMAAFMDDARTLDWKAGQVLEELDAQGLTGNTIVICTTDHGIAFPSMKCNLTVHGTGVLLIMRGPGGFCGGKVSDALVSQVDILPTICELLGIEKPAWLQGRSLMPLLRGETEEINDHIFAEVTYHAACESMRSVRSKRYNYIRRYGDRRRPVLPNVDDSPSKSVWVKHGWRDRELPEEELYDCLFDPCERHNIIHEPSMAGVRATMRGVLDDWMRRTDDPPLNGAIPLVKGAKVNDPNGDSPCEPICTL
jgi:arylsulfatase A-like enzyme